MKNYPWYSRANFRFQHYANMLWLDSSYPPEKTGQPGGDRGDCAADSGVPADVESKQADVRHKESLLPSLPIFYRFVKSTD